LQVPQPTLRKHYFQELSIGETALATLIHQPHFCWRGRDWDFWSSASSPIEGVAVLDTLRAYATQGGAMGGARQTSLAARRRFCAVAVSSTSSLTPLNPRKQSRSSLRMRFMCANLISTFLRSRRDCWKASVLARARTWSRTSSSMSRETLRAFAVVHRDLNSHLLQS
jgi:hypothetical protein